MRLLGVTMQYFRNIVYPKCGASSKPWLKKGEGPSECIHYTARYKGKLKTTFSDSGKLKTNLPSENTVMTK